MGLADQACRARPRGRLLGSEQERLERCLGRRLAHAQRRIMIGRERRGLAQLDRTLSGKLEARDQPGRDRRAAQQRIAQILGQEGLQVAPVLAGSAASRRCSAISTETQAAGGHGHARLAAAAHDRTVGREQLGQPGPPAGTAPDRDRLRQPAREALARPSRGRACSPRQRAAALPAVAASRSDRWRSLRHLRLAFRRRQQELRLEVGEPCGHHQIFGCDLNCRACRAK